MSELKWPIGCHSPNSCAKHRRCMYIKCRHESDKGLPARIEEIEEGVKALRASQQQGTK